MPPLPPPPGESTELRVPAPAAGQFSYHVRMAAVFALAGEHVESAAESLLAWTMLLNQWPGAESAAAQVAGELIDQHSAALSESVRNAALARARGLALDIEAHYVSVGCVAEAALYADVADAVAASIDALSAR